LLWIISLESCFTAGRTHEASPGREWGAAPQGVGSRDPTPGSAASRQACARCRLGCGGAPGGAGPYVPGAARSGRRARWLARDARAGPFAKDLPREPRKLPWGLANPWRLPALHHPASARERKRGRAYPAPENKEYG